MECNGDEWCVVERESEKTAEGDGEDAVVVSKPVTTPDQPISSTRMMQDQVDKYHEAQLKRAVKYWNEPRTLTLSNDYSDAARRYDTANQAARNHITFVTELSRNIRDARHMGNLFHKIPVEEKNKFGTILESVDDPAAVCRCIVVVKEEDLSVFDLYAPHDGGLPEAKSKLERIDNPYTDLVHLDNKLYSAKRGEYILVCGYV